VSRQKISQMRGNKKFMAIFLSFINYRALEQKIPEKNVTSKNFWIILFKNVYIKGLFS
jgi:hypothetical protein